MPNIAPDWSFLAALRQGIAAETTAEDFPIVWQEIIDTINGSPLLVAELQALQASGHVTIGLEPEHKQGRGGIPPHHQMVRTSRSRST